MNVASLELCKQLYELSGWDDTYLQWALFREPRVVNADEWAKNMDGEPDLIITADTVFHEDHNAMLKPAYNLSYILSKLPMNIQIDETVGWLTLTEYDTGWQCCYLMEEGYAERQYNFTADTPEDATCKLAIELFKAGVLVNDMVATDKEAV